MYLQAEKYYSSYDFRGAQQVADCKAISTLVGMTPHPGCPSLVVRTTIGYWRKANAIHKWLVDHVQDGVDECQQSRVDREQLQELLDLCKSLWKNQSKKGVQSEIQEKLPPASGFFFGSTEVEEGYWQDIGETIEILTNALTNESLADCDFYYQASW